MPNDFMTNVVFWGVITIMATVIAAGLYELGRFLYLLSSYYMEGQ